jgi:hypothetical protein
MSINVRVVTLDDTGHGKVTVQPCFYAGAKGGNVSNVTAEDGQSLGTAFLTRGTMPAVEGAVDVSGTPDTQVSLYFDWD